MREFLLIDIDSAVLESQVFSKGPTVPDDDMGELRMLGDLAYAFKIWIGFGMWPHAVAQLVQRLVKPGVQRRLALAALPATFANMDDVSYGVIQPGQILLVLRKILNPGLTEKNFL